MGENNLDLEKIKSIHPEKSIDNSVMSEVGANIQSSDEKRKDKEKNHIHLVKVIFIWTLAVCFIVVGLVVVVNLVLPENWRWLNKDDLMSLKSIFVSGVGGAILGRFSNKIMD